MPNDNQSALPNISELTLAQKVVHNIAASSEVMSKMAAAEKQAAEKQAEVDALIPQVCDALLRHERIRGDQREKAAELLADPAKALQLLIKVASHRNADEESTRLGQGVSPTEKTASSIPSTESPFVGRQGSGPVRQSTAALFSGLGLPVPAGE